MLLNGLRSLTFADKWIPSVCSSCRGSQFYIVLKFSNISEKVHAVLFLWVFNEMAHSTVYFFVFSTVKSVEQSNFRVYFWFFVPECVTTELVLESTENGWNCLIENTKTYR